mmetsp:Transcript_48080/g.104837  ORF Transcript_48080/g.104837 Transcript_48080/m.104837 type:complete len:305 (+) Transcript_48080:704-1618(+)
MTFKTANRQNEMYPSKSMPQTKEISPNASRASTHVKPPVMEPYKVCIDSSRPPKRVRKVPAVMGSTTVSVCVKYSEVMSVKISPNTNTMSIRRTSDHANALRVRPMQKRRDFNDRTNFTTLTIRRARVTFATRRTRNSRILLNAFDEESSWCICNSRANSRRLEKTTQTSSSIQHQSSPQKTLGPKAVTRKQNSTVNKRVYTDAMKKRTLSGGRPGLFAVISTWTAMKMELVKIAKANMLSNIHELTILRKGICHQVGLASFPSHWLQVVSISSSSSIKDVRLGLVTLLASPCDGVSPPGVICR